MKIVVECGATKADWRAICQDGMIRSARTSGLNPSSMSTDMISEVVRKAVPALNPDGKRVGQIFFYGAGLVSEAVASPIRSVLEDWCPFAEVTFHSDLMAAARALFGDADGVVAIMGTGSNSCLYERGEIVRNISAGGYILGDEGSGAYLGRTFLADFIKGLLPEEIEQEFREAYDLDYGKIVKKVYHEPAASAFMASFAPFILDRLYHPYVEDLVSDCIDSFMRRSLSRYSPGVLTKVGVAGTFGCVCEKMVRKLGEKYDLDFVKFIQSPIDELVKYHGI